MRYNEDVLTSGGSSRRQFLGASALGGATLALEAMPWLRMLRPVSAAEVKLESSLVRLDADIEPMVRLIEQTPRERLLEQVAARIRGGASYREVLTALMLAGVRNVPPRPTVGFKFHAVLVVHSAHLASVASPDEDRWLPIFWALDFFKSAQAQTMRESGWRMSRADEANVPPAHQARQRFIEAMEKWDEPAADVSAASVARHLSRGEAFELFARYAARDFRDIGHKTIYVANSFRTLDTIGWQHAEPVLRSLAHALLKRGEEDPISGDATADRPWRENAPLANELRNDWTAGRIDSAATAEFLALCRDGSHDDTPAAVVRMLNDGISPRSIWDGLFCAAGEWLMRRPGIVALHAVTMTNAMHYCWQSSAVDETRRALILQNAAFLPMFRNFGGSNAAALRIDQLDEPKREAEKQSPQTIFSSLEHDRMDAARRTIAYLHSGGSAQELMTTARRLVFLKGTNSHDYKFSSAVMEDYHQLSPEWRDRFFASSMFYLRGTDAPDNALVQRTRAALNS